MALWNNFTKPAFGSIINKSLNTSSITKDYHGAITKIDRAIIYLCVPFYGDKGCSLIKNYICKTRLNYEKERPITFSILYDITKNDFFWSIKDKTPASSKQSFLVYEFVGLMCSINCVEKAERTLFERNVKQVWSDKGSFNIHLNECSNIQHMPYIIK